ncbi:serine/threonine-protein kinase [Streptomyces sp. NPDC048629]|uniref:serine/threonine-protein kinase n=1 Tax=Streptomyces sp. NPDC048629 TaxID=3154824 RepID=UPI003429C655
MTRARVQPLGTDDPRQLGPYRLIGRLGAGGMGRVYLARAAGDNRLVAVKTPLAEGDISATDRRRFAREVTVARRVDSAYTARVLAADPDAEQPWMASEYIAAPSLAELVRAEGKVPASAVRWVAAGTAEALVTLHDAGIVHRDVKPQNILLPLGGPRLIDFGISHAADLTRTSLTLGTIAFTSPEQARGEPSTEASDVYSLGATLFHLAVGRPPYPHDDDTLRLLVKVQRAELDLSGLPKALAPLVSPCLALDPGARPEPRDVLTEFTTALAGLPASSSGARWLPPKWTALIEEYARQGRTLGRGAPTSGPEDLTVNQRTGPVPGPGPTQVYTQVPDGTDPAQAAREEWERKAREAHEREAEEARAREAREARRRREEELRRRAQAEAEAKARKEAEAKARKEAEARAARAAEEARKRQKPPAGPDRAKATGNPSNGPRPATSSTGGTGGGTPSPTATDSGGKAFGTVLAFLAVAFVVFVWQPWESDTPTGGTGPSSSYSATPTPTPTPTPEPEDLAFAAVDQGDCLTVYDDGYDKWSTQLPQVVECGTPTAYTRVYAKYTGAVDSDSCDKDIDLDYWLHRSDTEADVLLCLERKFTVGQCFPAQVKADGSASADLMEIWRCGAEKVPQGNNEVMQITGFLKPGQDCGEGYWNWKVDGGDTVLCSRGT